jgi:glycerol-3-phosphate dehydrogenase
MQHGDVYRVRQSSHERRAFLKVAPHLVSPLPIVIPTYGHGMKGKAALRAGMALYDLLTIDKNRGVPDASRQIPWGRPISRDRILELFPGLEREGLTGGAVFCDGQMYNPPRLVLAFLKSAVAAGAAAANYVEATGLLRKDDTVVGVVARDTLSGDALEIRAKVVLNAAGPYAERLLARAADIRLSPPGTYSRDACFVVPRRLLDGDLALAVQGKTHDPEAVLSRGERHLFIAPWRNYTLIGTWHVVYRDDPDGFTVSDAELERFIAEVNASYPDLRLNLDDVSMWNAGLVPFGENPEGAEHLRYGHRSRLIDHARTDGVHNFVSLIGVRFTTGRYEAERAINLVFRKLGYRGPKCRTDSTPVVGGDISDVDGYVAEAGREYQDTMDTEVVRSLVRNYGSEFGRVVGYSREDPSLASPVGGSKTIKAQVVHAVREEMAQTLGDVVFRRTDLATGEYPGEHVLRECAQILANELALTSDAAERQVADVVSLFPERVTRNGGRRGA